MLRFFLTLILIVATLSGVIGAAAVPVEAQNATATGTPEPVEETTTIQLSPTTTIDRWEYENETFAVTISAVAPARVTLTDAGRLSEVLSGGDGAATARVNTRTVTITPGTQTVQFRAQEVDGAAAITLKANNANGLVAIRTDSIGGTRDPVEWQTTAALTLFAAIGAGYWTYRKAKSRWEDEQKEVSRIA
jgi:hypothetical protein